MIVIKIYIKKYKESFMKKTVKNLSVVLAIILMLSMLLSSCGFLGGLFGKDTEETNLESDVQDSGNVNSGNADSDGTDSNNLGNDDSNAAESGNENASDVTETETEEETEIPDLEVIDLGGREICVLWPELHGDGHYVHNEIAPVGTGGDVIDSAVHTRNTIVQRAYNVTITSEERFVSQIVKDVRSDAMASTSVNYSAAVSTIKFMTALAQEGWLSDYNDFTYYDESQPWWNHDLMQDFSIADARYFATGDIIYSDDFYPYSTYVNLTVSDQNQLEDNYYELVENKQWTLEEFHNRAKTVVTADYNKDCNTWEDQEIAGAVVNENFARATYYSAGKGMISLNMMGYPQWQMTKEYAFPILEKVIHIVHDNNACYNAGQWKDHAIREVSLFNQNKTLFLVEELIIAERITKSDAPADFKILPFPLYEEGDEYISVLNDAAVVTIPTFINDADDVCLVLSAMSRESMETLTPAFFETVLASRYMQDSGSVKTLEIILSSTVAPDVATIQDWGGVMTEFKRLAFANSTEFASYHDAHIDEVTGQIQAYKEILDAHHGRA